MQDTRALVSLHGREFGLNIDKSIVEAGRMLLPSWRDRGGRSVQFDHFNGLTMNAGLWTSHKGSDGGCADWAISSAKGGMVRGTTGAGASTMAVNGVQLDSGLNWEADQGGLEGAFGVKAAAITNLALYVGFTDQVSALEMPFTLSAGTLTSNCTDGFGFLFDTAATAATWKAVSVAADVDGAINDTGVAPTAAAYDNFMLHSDELGNVSFWLNGIKYAQNALGVTKTVPLTPVVAAFRRTTASTTIDCDYVWLGQDR